MIKTCEEEVDSCLYEVNVWRKENCKNILQKQRRIKRQKHLFHLSAIFLKRANCTFEFNTTCTKHESETFLQNLSYSHRLLYSMKRAKDVGSVFFSLI